MSIALRIYARCIEFNYQVFVLCNSQTGMSAEYYLDPSNQASSDPQLSHHYVLKQFGAEDDYADSMLNDQGKLYRDLKLFLAVDLRACYFLFAFRFRISSFPLSV